MAGEVYDEVKKTYTRSEHKYIVNGSLRTARELVLMAQLEAITEAALRIDAQAQSEIALLNARIDDYYHEMANMRERNVKLSNKLMKRGVKPLDFEKEG